MLVDQSMQKESQTEGSFVCCDGMGKACSQVGCIVYRNEDLR